MKNTLVLLVLFVTTVAGAQPRKGHEKIRQARIEFVKGKLALTPEEEKAFIPMYERMLDELDSLHKLYRKGVDMKDVDLTFMTDEDCEKLLEDMHNYKAAELEITRRYTEEFKKVLPVKKVAMIYKAEYEFKRELVKKLRQHKRSK